jgi:hypothetical protein
MVEYRLAFNGILASIDEGWAILTAIWQALNTRIAPKMVVSEIYVIACCLV